MSNNVSELMAIGVQQHAAGNYQGALEARLEAEENIEPSDIRLPGLFGTIGVTYERLGQDKLALDYVERSDKLFAERDQPEDPLNDIYIEHSNTKMFLGSLVLKDAFKVHQLAGLRSAQTTYAKARDILDEAMRRAQKTRKKSGYKFYQHEINYSRRYAVAHSMAGDWRTGLKSSANQFRFVKATENGNVTYLNSEGLSNQAKRRASRNVLLGAAGGVAVSLLNAFPYGSRKTAARVASKIV